MLKKISVFFKLYWIHTLIAVISIALLISGIYYGIYVFDSFTTLEDTALNIPAGGVLTNDTDVDSGSLTALLVNGPSHGQLTLNPNGTTDVTPILDSNGQPVSQGTATPEPGTLSVIASAMLVVAARRRKTAE